MRSAFATEDNDARSFAAGMGVLEQDCRMQLVLPRFQVADFPTVWPGEPDTPHIEEQEFPRYERR